MSVCKRDLNLDRILVEEVGQWGRFQLRTLLLMMLVAILSAMQSYLYLFTITKVKTRAYFVKSILIDAFRSMTSPKLNCLNTNFRCLIPECENTSAAFFSPPWLLDAVPTSGDSFDNCYRYPVVNISPNTSGSCPASQFDRSSKVKCQEYVYEHNNSAYFEFNLACDDWRPTLVGSANSVGYMLCLVITGPLADRWGRRSATAFLGFNLGWIGALAYFADSYTTYILIFFFQCLFGECCFTCAYILGKFLASLYVIILLALFPVVPYIRSPGSALTPNPKILAFWLLSMYGCLILNFIFLISTYVNFVTALEYVGPKYRVITGVIMSSSLAVGEMILGLFAWTEPYWRHLILMMCTPHMIIGIYYWIAPESIRWLMSKGRYEESLVILKEIAGMNGSALSEKTLEEFSEEKDVATKEKTSEPWLVCLVFKHKPILLRCVVTPIWWITCTLIYYGLTISSVGISGNKYLNYTALVAIEIPGCLTAVLFLDRIGRKALLITGFFISGFCQFAFIFISNGNYWASLSVFLIGKMSIAAMMTSLYVYTAELYPTRYRTRLLAYSSMIGRVGAIAAPLMPGLAADVWEQLPFLLFGVMALISGLLVLLTPETLGTTLPDSMEEAASLGKDSSVVQCLRSLVFRSKSYTVR